MQFVLSEEHFVQELLFLCLSMVEFIVSIWGEVLKLNLIHRLQER